MDEALLRDAELARDRLNEFQAQADRGRLELHQAIRRLHSAGRSMREIASTLGLSHQRVHQIVSGGKPIAEARKGTLFNRLVRRNRKECEPGGESNWFDQIVGERLYIDAREALTLSQLEARALNHSYLGTEHLLLGLMRADIGLAPCHQPIGDTPTCGTGDEVNFQGRSRRGLHLLRQTSSECRPPRRCGIPVIDLQ